MVSISTNADEVADEFTKLAATLEPTVVKEGIQTFLVSVQAEAKRQHRYTRRTGKLERAVKVERAQDGGSVYLDDGAAPYGKYIHNGTRYIDSDPFLTDAYDRKERDLDRSVSRSVDHAIQQAGL